MELWNDYEGKELDGRYRLERLLGPKGRSAWFAGKDAATGASVTIRVIESLNDEDEILTRWTAVKALGASDLVGMRACDKTVLDGTHLVYAVQEPTDAELEDVLRDRPLTGEETRQVGAAVVGALEALHGRGLVHEHVDATSVRAVGETVKLRSDCVREAPEGADGDAARQRDVRDLVVLLAYAVTGQRDAASQNGVGVRLPRPYDDMVRHGMHGTWGLKEIGAVVRPVAATAPATMAAVPGGVGPRAVPAGRGLAATGAGTSGAGAAGSPAAGPVVRVPASGPGVAAAVAGGGRAVAAAAAPVMAVQPVSRVAAAEPMRAGAVQTSPEAVAAALGEPATAGAGWRAPVEGVVATRRGGLEVEPETQGPRWGLWVGVAVVLGLIVWLVAHISGRKPAGAAAPAATTASATAGSAATVAAPVRPAKPSAGMPTGGTAARSTTTRVPVSRGEAPQGAQWRVVAYTYLHEDQAQHKAQEIGAQHANLHPEVFSPTGHGPYLVTLGGWMTQDEAARLKNRERGRGLPRDLYAQNYRSR